MTKIPTLYSDYKECMLDLDIYGKIVATPQQSLEDLEKTLFEEFQRRKPMPTLEYKRYELSRLINPDYRIAYNKELELQDNERLLDLQSDLEASYENIDFEDLSSLIPTTKELFSYENHITDSMRNDIVSKYDLKTGELFEPGIAQTENIVGSVEEDEATVLTEEKIAGLGVDKEEEVSMADDPMEVIAFNDREQTDVTYEVDDDEVTYEAEDDSDDESSDDYNDDSDADSLDDYNEDSEESDEDDYSDYDSDEDEDEDADSEDEDGYEDDDSEDEADDAEDLDDEDDYDSYGDEDEDDYSDYDSEDTTDSEDDDSEEDDYDNYEDSDNSDEEDDYAGYDSDDSENDSESSDDDDDSEDENDYDSYDIADDVPEQEVDTGRLRGSSVQQDSDFDDISDSFMDSVLDEPMTATSEHIINKPVETPVTPAQIYNNISSSEVVDRSAEPTDIRAFLRKHPRCDYDFALKYFTKKQINDAIKIGKIIKKGNILKI